MLPFHIRLERLKLTYCGSISNISKDYCKTGTVCFLFLSSHVFTALEFDSNNFGVLLRKIVKPRDNINKIKPTIGKVF